MSRFEKDDHNDDDEETKVYAVFCPCRYGKRKFLHKRLKTRLFQVCPKEVTPHMRLAASATPIIFIFTRSADISSGKRK
jgi:hypothetical protein